MSSSLLFAGLGNPGFKYVNTRHNIGFLFADIINSLALFPDFKHEKSLFGEVSVKNLFGKEVIILKPDTYMNLSGKSISSAASFFNILPENIFVVHDDMDFDFGRHKIKKGGGSAGHNGVQSVINFLNTPDFYRIRLGIGKKSEQEAKDYVLGYFSEEEMEFISAGWALKWKEIFETIVKDGAVKAMNLYNKS